LPTPLLQLQLRPQLLRLSPSAQPLNRRPAKPPALQLPRLPLPRLLHQQLSQRLLLPSQCLRHLLWLLL
jgi:hypothetical protein